MRTNTVSHRERVLLALDHKEADRVPIAMVCSGINSPAKERLEERLKSERGVTVHEFLHPLLDIQALTPPLINTALAPAFDVVGGAADARQPWGGCLLRDRPPSIG